MNYEELHHVGGTFGADGIGELIERAEAICIWERQRIELANEPQLVALKAQYNALLEEEKELKSRLARTAQVPGINVRKRRIAINWIVATVLIVSGFVLSLLTLEPFRLGLKGVVYSIGIAFVVPFLVERMLDHFPSTTLKRVLVAFACLVGLSSMVLLAAVRGNLLGEQVKQDQASSAVIEGEESQQNPKQNTFYEDTVPLLQLVMALLALTMEIGAGIAILEADRMSESVDGEYEMLKDRLREAQRNLGGLAEAILTFQNEAPMFVAKFWRDFYWSLLKGAIKNAARRFAMPSMALLIMIWLPGQVAAQNLNLVVAVDLSKSVDERGSDGKTAFAKNIAAIGHLLQSIPSGTHVTIIGITENSFSNPYLILRANLGSDEGYFGEKLARGRREIVRAWKARSLRLEPSCKHTDIFGALFLASELFSEDSSPSKRVLVIYSDMKQDTPEFELRSSAKFSTAQELNIVERKKFVAKLSGVQVYLSGANAPQDRFIVARQIQEFWKQYFAKAGANLRSYSAISELPTSMLPDLRAHDNPLPHFFKCSIRGLRCFPQ